MTEQTLAERAATVVKAVISDAAAAASQEHVERLQAEARRWRSPDVAVVVAGETNRGKTSLVNAILGGRRLPVSATETTTTFAIVKRGEPERAVIHRVGVPSEEVGLDALAAALLDAGDDVEGVLVEVDAPVLHDGLVLIDTPGVGGLDASLGRATLSVLGRADAMIMVLDPDEPLSASELSFLSRASDRIEHVIFVVAKVDRSAAWHRIIDDDRALLERHAPRFAAAPLFPVSPRLKLLADELAAAGSPDDALADESGVAALVSAIETTVVERVQIVRLANLLRLSSSTLDALARPWQSALTAADGSAAAEAEVARAQRALEELRDTSERLAVDVADRFGVLRDTAQSEFSRVIRALSARLGSDAASVGEEVFDRLREDLQSECAGLAEELNDKVDTIVVDARSVLADVSLDLPSLNLEDLHAPELADFGADGETRVSDPGARMRVASSVSSGGAALVAFGTRIGADPALLAVMGATALLAVARAAIGVRLARRQRNAAAIRSQLREALEAARAEVGPAIRQQLLVTQRHLERTIRSTIRTRNAELHAVIAESNRLARAATADRQRKREDAQRALAAIDARRKQVDAVSREVEAELIGALQT